jgi:hypothetical protein
MTEQVPSTGHESAAPPAWQDQQPAADESVSTGVPGVDAVLAEVDRLDDLPLEEHLSTFERAHESLRSALDAEPGDPA